MDDGSYSSPWTLHLNVQNFTNKEQELIRNVLFKKFGLETTLQKDTKKGKIFYRIYIRRKSRLAFRDLVKPYVIDHFSYKMVNFKDK
jgi:hypothetical protein